MEVKNNVIYVGTYTGGESKGIYTFRFEEDGKLTQLNPPVRIDNPSYINISENKKYLYAVIEQASFEGEHGGGVAAFRIDGQSGTLEPLGCKGTKGVDPCHVTADPVNKRLYVANYTEGSFSVFDILYDGSIGELRNITTHEGRGTNEARQEKAHVHYVIPSANGRFFYAVDLGIDKVKVYSISGEEGHAVPVSEYEARPGSGPRHLAFHPRGEFVYLLNELSSNITVLKLDDDGLFTEAVQHISMLPEDFDDLNTGAAVRLAPDGKYLYASNRGHDSIAAYKINEASGKLSLISITPAGGKCPRDFEINPSGRFLFSANQNSNTITVFEINRENGELKPLNCTIDVPNPTCIKFL